MGNMTNTKITEKQISLRVPTALDGMALHRLVRDCPPLDTNSAYCNLLQCTHFADTAVAAESGSELVGFISGYIVPGRPDTLFVWQVAVGAPARGQGLATRMLRELLTRPACADVTWLETTVTDANTASWSLFQGLASKLLTELHTETMFERDLHFAGIHDTERLARIGPLVR